MVFEALSEDLPGRVVLTAEPTESFIGKASAPCTTRAAGRAGGGAGSSWPTEPSTPRDQGMAFRRARLVLCDRYYASTIAYQGALLKERMGGAKRAVEWLKAMNEPIIRASGPLPSSDGEREQGDREAELAQHAHQVSRTCATSTT